MFKKVSLLAIFIALTCLGLFINHQAANALTASDWRAGNIIDDSLFIDAGSMTVPQIQAFLDKKVGTGTNGVPGQCDTDGIRTSEYGGGTRAQYAANASLHPKTGAFYPPFTCLKDYYEVPKTVPGPGIPANNYGGKPIPTGAKSAAQLIWDAAQQYHISPKVLLVKLGTESAGPLTSDDWPTLSQYTYAMGSHCPDSGPDGSANCDTDYSGFSIQISSAASLLRYYLDNMTAPWWPYTKPYQNNSIYWNVVPSGCGASNVYIANKATAALYTYTPYQPNQAAIDNMYGKGDNCSAYGNRNFWVTYNNWFGSTIGTPFFSYNGTTYIIGENDTYYGIASPTQLQNYGYGTAFTNIEQVDAKYISSKTNKGILPLIVRFDDNEIYVMSNGNIFHFPDSTTFQNTYGYTLGKEAKLSKEWQSHYIDKGDLSSTIKTSDRPEVYSVENGEKRHIINRVAYNSLGTPVYSSRPVTVISSQFVNSIGNGAPIATDGAIMKTSDTGLYGIWYQGTYKKIASSIMTLWGLKTDYIAPSSNIAQLPQDSTTKLDTYLQSASQKYIIDSGKKFTVDDSLLVDLGVTTDQFITVPSSVFNKFDSAAAITNLIKISGQDPVYKPTSGVLFHINSGSDFINFGYNWNQITTLSSNLAKHIFTTSPIDLLSSGHLLRVGASDTVYVVSGPTSKLTIPSREIFQQYGFSFDNVSQLTASQTSVYITGTLPLGRYLKDSSSKYWLIDNGNRYELSTTLLSPTNYNLADNVFVVSDSLITQIPKSTVTMTNILRGSDGKVYKIDSGKKCWFSTRQAFESSGNKWSAVRDVSDGLLNSISNGTNL